MFAWTHVCGHVYLCVHGCAQRGWQAKLGIFFSCFPVFFTKPRTVFFLLRAGVTGAHFHAQFFMWVLETGAQVLKLTWQVPH